MASLRPTALALLIATLPVSANAMTMPMAGDAHGRYLGQPDLVLTSAVLAAGGGADRFSSARLLAFLCGKHAAEETARLQEQFGAQQTSAFFHTFDTFMGLGVAYMRAHRIALPAPNPALADDPNELATSLRSAGVMPDGRFDIGYLIEHLLSRPAHVVLMREANASPAVGPKANASFHIIFTAAMNDLKSLDRLPY
jgi:hypothetical protein